MFPRRLWLTAILAAYLGYVAAHCVGGILPLWAYLLLGSVVNSAAIYILRRERARGLPAGRYS